MIEVILVYKCLNSKDVLDVKYFIGFDMCLY